MPESPDTFVPDVDEAETLTDNAFLAQIYSYRGTRSLFLSSCADLLLNSKNEASEEGVPGWSWLAPGGTLKRLDIQLSMYLSTDKYFYLSRQIGRYISTYLHIYIQTQISTYIHAQADGKIDTVSRQANRYCRYLGIQIGREELSIQIHPAKRISPTVCI